MFRLIKSLGLKSVPIVNECLKMNYTVEDLVKMAIGNSLLNSEVQREGLVFRPLEKVYHPKYGRISFKSINNEYLLKHGE